MIPSASSASISDRVRPSSPRSSSLCSPSSGACRSWTRSGPRENLHRKRAVAGASDHRMVHLLEEVAGRELRQVGLAVGLHDLAHGHAGIPQAARRSRRPTGRGTTPAGTRRSGRARASVPAAVAERGVGGPVRLAQGTAERHPLLVGGDRDRDPAVVAAVLVGTGDLVEVLRRRSGPAVAAAAEQRSVGGELDRLLGGDVEPRHRPSPPRRGRLRPSSHGARARASGRTARGARRWGHRRSTARTGGGRDVR